MTDRDRAANTTLQERQPSSRLDLNLLPTRHRPQAPPILSILLWVLLLVLAAALIPSWQWFAQQAEAYQGAVAEAERLANALRSDAPEQALDARATEVALLQTRAGELEAALTGLRLRPVVWSDVLPQVLAQTPPGIEFSDISDEGTAIRLEGTSVDEVLPLLLVERLAALGRFDDVRLEALDRLTLEEAPPSPTPSPTPRLRTTPTPAPTPTPPAAEPRFQFVLILAIPGGPQP